MPQRSTDQYQLSHCLSYLSYLSVIFAPMKEQLQELQFQHLQVYCIHKESLPRATVDTKNCNLEEENLGLRLATG